MIAVDIVLALLLIHFVSDFVLQSSRVALNKSKSNLVLLEHIAVYSMLFVVFVNPLYGLVNGVLHGVVDYFTSRITSALWKRGETHWFFVVIGFDQLLHVVILVTTYSILM